MVYVELKKITFKGDNGPIVNFSKFHHCCFTCLLRVEWHNLGLFYDTPPHTHAHTHSQKKNIVIIESLMNELNAVREA